MSRSLRWARRAGLSDGRNSDSCTWSLTTIFMAAPGGIFEITSPLEKTGRPAQGFGGWRLVPLQRRGYHAFSARNADFSDRRQDDRRATPAARGEKREPDAADDPGHGHRRAAHLDHAPGARTQR